MSDSNTFVFRGDFKDAKNPFVSEFLGVRPSAWCSGDALEQKEKLKDFIRKLSYGEIEDPEKAAESLMNEMNWG